MIEINIVSWLLSLRSLKCAKFYLRLKIMYYIVHVVFFIRKYKVKWKTEKYAHILKKKVSYKDDRIG